MNTMMAWSRAMPFFFTAAFGDLSRHMSCFLVVFGAAKVSQRQYSINREKNTTTFLREKRIFL